MSDDRLEAWELKLAAQAVHDAIGQWALALGSRNDLMSLWAGVPALACEAIVAVVTLRGADICLALAHRGQFGTAAFLAEVYTEWNHYRYDFINAVMAELGIEYEL